jgi:hypothetical protein
LASWINEWFATVDVADLLKKAKINRLVKLRMILLDSKSEVFG